MRRRGRRRERRDLHIYIYSGGEREEEGSKRVSVICDNPSLFVKVEVLNLCMCLKMVVVVVVVEAFWELVYRLINAQLCGIINLVNCVDLKNKSKNTHIASY